MDPATATLLAGAATGGIGAGLNYFSNKDANEQNLAMFNQNMMNTNSQITAARQYNTEMANTAHQREMEDLKKAGINPMMTAMGGNGAPAPTSPVSNAGNGNAIQPNRAIGDAIAGLLPTALGAAKTLADIKNVDKDSLLKDASTLAATTQAKVNTANARQAHENLKNMEVDRAYKIESGKQLARRRDAEAAKADAERNKAALDLDYEKSERILHMVGTGAGAANNATGAISNLVTPFLKQGVSAAKEAYKNGYLRGTRVGIPQ